MTPTPSLAQGHITGLEVIADDYDLFICDLWGVIHDGVEPYSEVADCLGQLRSRGKQILFLSNAPRPSRFAAEHLAQMGVDGSFYDGLVTSGDATVTAMKAGRFGTRPVHVGPERDYGLLIDSGLTSVAAEDADFVLCSGFFDDATDTPEKYVERFQRYLDLGLPMTCANPDISIVRAGQRVFCGGALAKRYEEMGGEVTYCGKPDPSIFDFVLADTEVSDRAKVLMIGDGGFTDILGANRSRIDALLIAGGIHHDVLGVDVEGKMSGSGADLAQRTEEFLAQNQLSARAVMPRLVW